jgi:hypothetical protein
MDEITRKGISSVGRKIIGRKVSESLTSIMMGDAFKNLDVED